MFYVFVGGLKAGYETISAVEVQFRPVFQKNLRTVNVIIYWGALQESVRSMMKAHSLNNGSGGCVFIFGTALNDRQVHVSESHDKWFRAMKHKFC